MEKSWERLGIVEKKRDTVFRTTFSEVETSPLNPLELKLSPYQKKFVHFGNPFKYKVKKQDNSQDEWNYDEDQTLLEYVPDEKDGSQNYQVHKRNLIKSFLEFKSRARDEGFEQGTEPKLKELPSKTV